MKQPKQFTLGKYLQYTDKEYKIKAKNSNVANSLAHNINISQSTSNHFARAAFMAFVDYIDGNDKTIKEIIADINSVKNQRFACKKKIEKALQTLKEAGFQLKDSFDFSRLEKAKHNNN